MGSFFCMISCLSLAHSPVLSFLPSLPSAYTSCFNACQEVCCYVYFSSAWFLFFFRALFYHSSMAHLYYRIPLHDHFIFVVRRAKWGHDQPLPPSFLKPKWHTLSQSHYKRKSIFQPKEHLHNVTNSPCQCFLSYTLFFGTSADKMLWLHFTTCLSEFFSKSYPFLPLKINLDSPLFIINHKAYLASGVVISLYRSDSMAPPIK